MRIFSSAEAKNHFGRFIDAARLEPVAITKYDRPFVVVMSIEEFLRLKTNSETDNEDDVQESNQRKRHRQ